MSAPTHRNEASGNALLDRIQANVRDLIAFSKTLLARVATLEVAHGHGVANVAMANRDYALTVSELAADVIRLTSTHTATRVLTVPGASDANAYTRWIVNLTGQSVTVSSTTGGTTATVSSSTSEKVLVYGSGVSTLT